MRHDELGRVEFEDDEYERLDKMLHFIALRYTNWSGLEYEDIKGELWAKTILLLKDADSVNMEWIAKCCYNVAHDMCRKAKKEKDALTYDTDLVEKTEVDRGVDFGDLLGNLSVQELVMHFPRGSAEQNYLVYLTLYLRIPIEEHKRRNLTYEKVFGDAPFRYRQDKAVARALGYSDDTSSGYRKAKYAVRDYVFSVSHNILKKRYQEAMEKRLAENESKV